MKKVVYTAIINDYDTLKEPTQLTNGWDYICFTNNKRLKSDVWKIKYVDVKQGDPIRTARDIKINFDNYVGKYDLSIWVDGSMIINTNLAKFCLNHYNRDFNLMIHPARNCVYQEANAVLQLKKDHKKVVTEQVIEYHTEGYPQNNGMVQTGIMIRKHTESNKKFCDLWWNEVYNKSRRDQLSFNYCAYKFGLDFHTFDWKTSFTDFVIQKHLK